MENSGVTLTVNRSIVLLAAALLVVLYRHLLLFLLLAERFEVDLLLRGCNSQVWHYEFWKNHNKL